MAMPTAVNASAPSVNSSAGTPSERSMCWRGGAWLSGRTPPRNAPQRYEANDSSATQKPRGMIASPPPCQGSYPFGAGTSSQSTTITMPK
jgi:hypothetical protein